MALGDRAVGVRRAAQPADPVAVGRRQRHLRQEPLGDGVEQPLLAREVVVDRHGLDAEGGPQLAGAAGLEPVAVDQRQRRRGQAVAAELRAPGGRALPAPLRSWLA